MPSVISIQASIDPRAKLADDVEIGPCCYIGPHVTIGSGTRLMPNVTIMGHTTIGNNNVIFPGAVIGGDPQDTSYHGGETQVIIGDNNTIREGVTINRASEKENGITSIGSHCFFMSTSHVAHDCHIGNHVMITNAVLLGGHVHVHDNAILAGMAGVHHFSTVGSYSFTGGMSRVLHDVPPFMLADGNPAMPRCLNIVGLKRNGFTQESIEALSEAHRLLYRAKVGLDHAREILRSHNHLVPAVNHLLDFVQTQHEGRHGRAREKGRRAA